MLTRISIISAGVVALATSAVAEAGVSFEREVRPLLEARCAGCHNPEKKKGKLDLSTFAALARGGADGVVVVARQPDESRLVKVVTGPDPEMPPSGDHLRAAEVELLRRWIAEGAVDDTRPGAVVARPRRHEPARVTVRRLTRLEYDNTVRDLLGSSLRPGRTLPEDGVSFGFDRIADALGTSPLHLELYERAAEALVGELYGREPGDPARRRILVCDPAAAGCAPRILRAFAPRAWRRPVAEAELAPFLALAARTPGADGLALALQGLLLAPDFLYRIERGGDPRATGAQPLGAYEIASRLSYFVWSSMPDDELYAAAAANRLQTRAELARQLDRMLADPKSQAFSADFPSQWLGLRKLADHGVRREMFRGWGPEMRRSMLVGTQLFFQEFLGTRRPVSEMLTAEFTFVDDRLARLYGLPEPDPPDEFARVATTGLPRAGLLTHPAILTVTSHPDRTSPTARGNFVLERVLCEPPPPPPPGVAALEDGQVKENETVRELLERHRQAASCRVCHQDMDTIGLGLEQFDLVGRFRTKDQDEVIDPRGALREGSTFGDALELVKVLATGPRFERCLTKQLLTYAVGRGFEEGDEAATVAEAAARAGGGRASFRDLLLAVVTSDAFRMRGAAPRPETATGIEAHQEKRHAQ